MSITSNLNHKDKDRLERIWNLLQDAEKLQQERITAGFDYVNLYVEDVESDWLENWGEESPEPPVRLRQWFHDVFETDWQSIEAIFSTEDNSIALKTAEVKRSKWIDLEQPVALSVTLEKESSNQTSILVEVHSTESQYLPENMQMTLLSPFGEVRGEAIAHRMSQVIQLELTLELGEEFTVELTIGDRTVTQDFLM